MKTSEIPDLEPPSESPNLEAPRRRTVSDAIAKTRETQVTIRTTTSPSRTTTSPPVGDVAPAPAAGPTGAKTAPLPNQSRQDANQVVGPRTAPVDQTSVNGRSTGAPAAATVAIDDLRKNLTSDERAELAEMMHRHSIPENHPIISWALEVIVFRRGLADMTTTIHSLLERVEKSGRIVQFMLSPSMSIGMLFMGVTALAALAWAAGAAVAGARLHETIPLYPFTLVLGLALGYLFSKRSDEKKPEQKRASTW